MKALLFLAVVLVASGCATFEETVTYNPGDEERLEQAKNVRIKTTDGKVYSFKKIEVVKIEGNVLFVKAWHDLNAEPKKLKFNLDEVVIESDRFSPRNTVGFFLSAAILFGIVLLIQILRE